MELNEDFQSDSLLWRQAPVSNESARQVVYRFFEAVAAESEEGMGQLLAEDALFHRPNQNASPALLAWVRRFSAADYSGRVVSRDVPIRVLDRASCEHVAEHTPLHLLPGPDELLAIVHLPSPPSQTARIWGTEVQLVLASSGDDWKVQHVWEDYVGK